jgi:hypothetical protein
VVVIDQVAAVGTEMSEDMLRQPGKVGNIAVEEEAVITMMKTTIKDLHVVIAEIHVAVKAEVGSGMKKDILKRQWKAGNIARAEGTVIMMKTTNIKEHRIAVEEAVIMMRTTIIRELHKVAVEEAVITMKMMTTTKDPHATVVGEVAITMKTMTIIKDLHVAVADAGVDTVKMTTIKGLHVAVEEVQVAVKAEVGSVMNKVIPKQLWKAGSNAVEKETEAVMTTMTIIKDLHVVAAEVPAVVKAEDGMAMKKNIPARHDKAGVVVIDFLNCNFRKGTLQQLAQCTFSI